MTIRGSRRRAPEEGRVKVIAVVGSASGAGKTRLVCAILRAIPGLGAVKISPREEPPRVEWGSGASGKDTDRFAASGAAAVARIVSPRESVPAAWGGMRGALASLPGVVVEGAGALTLPEERFTVLVAAPATLGERPERDERLLAAADWVVVVRPAAAGNPDNHAFLDRQRARRHVHSVCLGEERWALEGLIESIRRFLSNSSGAADATPLSPFFSKGDAGGVDAQGSKPKDH